MKKFFSTAHKVCKLLQLLLRRQKTITHRCDRSVSEESIAVLNNETFDVEEFPRQAFFKERCMKAVDDIMDGYMMK